MIRIILKRENVCNLVNAGGSIEEEFKTFEVSIPEVEAYLRPAEKSTYETRHFVGIEFITESQKGQL